MMGNNTNLVVDYGIGTEQKCSGVLFEIPSLEIIGGDVIDLRLWGMSHEMLVPYNILQGLSTIGPGQLKMMPNEPITENVQFGGSISALTDWYISRVYSIVATSDIKKDDGSTIGLNGKSVTGLFSWINNVLSSKSNFLLTGSIRIVYESSQNVQESVDFYETNEYQAEWPIYSIGSVVATTPLLIINQATSEVQEYAAQGENVTSLFVRSGYSCIRVKDGTKLYGTVKVQYTRSPYYKLWQWTVPIGKAGQYWFFIYKNNLVTNKFSIEVPDLTSGIPEPRNISLFIFGRDSETKIPNARVYIGGIYYGMTDVNGILNINGILTGTYSLKVIAAGYLPTDQDNLSNDEITIY